MTTKGSHDKRVVEFLWGFQLISVNQDQVKKTTPSKEKKGITSPAQARKIGTLSNYDDEYNFKKQ